MRAQPRALVAMSGGVDSSVAAALLVEQGHEVVGVFMRNGVSSQRAREKSCCSASDAGDAASVADRLGIPFYAVDYAAEFQALIEHFASEYRAGRTPNPCVLCNQHLKFGRLFSLADAVGAGIVATGHYARALDGGLYRAADAHKDQSYYLFGIPREHLPRVRFPLGGMRKAQVRERARELRLRTADKPESMEICFVPGRDYQDVVRRHGGGGRPGRFVDAGGKDLGGHDGIDGFTIGQRHGLPALGVPHFVQSIDAATGTVTLGGREGLLRGTAGARGVRWLVAPPAQPLAVEVQVRARSAPAPALVRQETEDRVRIEFEQPQEAVTPGQAAVFYAGDRVLGGGWLD
jgi:tRNA-specific 2-thiouridylase